MRKLIFFLALLLIVPGTLPAGVVEHRLGNGLKVIIKQDRRAPIAISQVWYKVGSSYEHGGITGVSHLLEHMMFKGTEQLPPGEFSRIIAANGGEENAFTGRDYTAYFQTLSSDRLEVSFELEADRMRRLKLLPEEFLKEREVVKEERRMRTEDDPTSLTYEQFLAGAYAASPYRSPVIGWMADIEALEIEDLRAWYRKWYAPNNATLVVVGDVEPEQVIQLAEKHFGPLKPEKIEPPKPRSEPRQRGMKRFVVKVPAKQPFLVLGYKTPVVGWADEDWEPYALDMLAYVLAGGGSARLSNDLIRGSRVAVSANASYSTFSRLPEMLMLHAVPSPGTSIDRVEAALREEVERFKNEPVTEEEMERVRNQIVAAKVFEKDSVFYQAMLIGQLETIGLDWRLADEYVERLKKVTPEQIRQVAQRYLVDENLNVAVLEPLPMENVPGQAAGAEGVDHGG